jgi:hypothetical protein
MFFVSVASKGVSVSVSSLFSTLIRGLVSVDSKGSYRLEIRTVLEVLILNSLRQSNAVREQDRRQVLADDAYRVDQELPTAKRKAAEKLPQRKKFRTLT